MACVLLMVNSSVYPSWGALAASAVPMVPPAPGRLSITNDWPSSCATFCATTRATKSVAPLAGNGTITRMACSGQAAACAWAVLGKAAPTAQAAIAAIPVMRAIAALRDERRWARTCWLLGKKAEGKVEGGIQRVDSVYEAGATVLPWVWRV